MSTAQGSLLVVDDNEMNRDMLTRRLARRGYTVAVAVDGYQALAMLTQQQFDLVLLDVMMPGISGLDVLKTLREQYSVADLPVIMVTAKDQSEDIVTALELGANDYVTKPLDFPVVVARIETHLALKRAMQEIRRLAAQLERRNQFIRDTFGRYLTSEVVASLLDTPEGLRLGGEKRHVTMLMADLRGFTSLSERLTPEQVMAVLNRYLGTMVEVIMPYQGTIDEFIGDAIFVIFGAPVWREDDAQRAVACAVAMQQAMVTVNEANTQVGLPAVEMGIGVHTGEVVVGNIGSHKRTKYGVVGSHVNLTARIQSYTVGGQILISEATRRVVGRLARIAKQMAVEAKGIAQPVNLYELRGIGSPYNLFLPEHDVTLWPLQQELPLQYTVLEGEHLSQAVYQGRLCKLSRKGGEVLSNYAVRPWSNLRIRLLEREGEAPLGELYAKVVRCLPGEQLGFAVHFTSLSQEAESFIQRLLAVH
jgi:class 3 adenylate cyclase/CheY-like chemotaxis protein